MTAKEYLNQISNYELSISQIEREIDRLSFDMQRAPDDEIKRLQERRHDMVLQEVRARDRIIDQIRSIGGLYGMVLYDHYVEGMTFRVIAEKSGYSLDYIVHSHGRALKEFEHKFL